MNLAWYAAAGGLLGGWAKNSGSEGELVSSGGSLGSSGWKWFGWIAGILGGITFGPGGALYGVFATLGPKTAASGVLLGFIGGYLVTMVFDDFVLFNGRSRSKVGVAARGVVR